ncbi:MAG: leucine-rich repeat domain-containing protein [Planctomycetota bacterium]
MNAVWIDGDYHLLSEFGRYKGRNRWDRDEFTSGCIDSGHPSTSLGEEPSPNGGIINIGAYGATSQASMSSPTQEPVYFADADIKASVELVIGVNDPTPTNMLALTVLDFRTRGWRNGEISDLTGLEYAKNLSQLWLSYNQISDISALAGLMNLFNLDLRGNPLNQEACDIYIPQIIENNPNIELYYDECLPSPNTIYVNDDAPADPGAGNPQISDTNEDGTPEHPFDTIQEAIDSAEDGDTVLVHPGIYREEINFLGKAITVQGVIVSSAGAPVLQSPDDFAVSFYSGEGPDSVLKNFIIKNSFMGVFITGGSPTISNLTIVSNKYGIEAYAGSEPVISNCIFWYNSDNDLFQCRAFYSCIERAGEGEGNITFDPLFADPDSGDYHLRAERGRYWPEHDIWVLDKITSPCIDAGDPFVDSSDEPLPNGGRINMGAYGGTSQASLSTREWGYFADANLKAAVEQALGVTDPTPTDMLSLTSFSCSYRGIVDLTGLEYATNLTFLSLYRNQISDISALAGITNLEHLSLSHNQISDISALAGLTNLEHLSLLNNQISDISELSGLTKLMELSLESNQISDISSLSGLKNLTLLSLSYNQTSDISALADMTNLTELYLSKIQISDISALAGLTNLTELNLWNNQISDISAVAGLTNLEFLILADNQISDISSVADLINLKGLYLENNQISDISVLAEMTNLTALFLGGNDIIDISLLAGRTNLTHLYLDNNQISDISALTELMSLVILHLQKNPLNQEACDIHIPKIRENNPGIDIRHDP